MRNTLVLLTLAIAAGALGGCDDTLPTAVEPPPAGGRPMTEARPVSDFDDIALEGVGRLIIDQTGTESLSVTAPEDVIDLLESEVVDGRLTLGPRPGARLPRSVIITYRLTVKELHELQVAGAGTVEVNDIRTDALRTSIAGAGHVTISGRTTRQSVNVSGAGCFDGRDFTSRIANVDAAGAARVRLRVSDSLAARLSGACALEYLGDPIISVSASPACTVKQL
jgi:hypothetical protein